MIYNKKGQNLLLAILTGVMIFMFGMLFMNHVPDDVSAARAIGLDCTNPTISDGNKVTCLAVDAVIPILFIAIVSLAAGAILSRFII
jgi:hypothetical protein